MFVFLITAFRLMLMIPMVMFCMLIFVEMGTLSGTPLGVWGMIATGLLAVGAMSFADFLSFMLFMVAAPKVKEKLNEPA